MCDNRESLANKSSSDNNAPKRCKKCQGKNGDPVIVIRSDDGPLCKPCFLIACTHKFRSGFGKSQLVRDGEKVLVGYSGGASSTAMLHLIQQGLSESAHRKLRFRPFLVHVNEGNFFNLMNTEVSEIMEKVENILKSTGFEYRIITLDDLLGDLPDSKELLNSKSGAQTLTSRVWLLNNLKIRGLVRLSEQLGCSRVLLGVSATRLSIGLLSAVAQGNGQSGATMTAFSDNRFGDVSIVRPMREFSIKEIGFLNRLCDLETVQISNWETGTPAGTSIDRLTESFLSGLQAGFPSTTCTVFRTAGKLTAQNDSETLEKCKICANPLCAVDNGDGALAQNSLQESHRLLGRSMQTASDLCYTCRILRREMANPEALDRCLQSAPGRDS